MIPFKIRNARPGVTLIESVIALTIIAIMGTVLLSSQGYALRSGVSTAYEQEVVLALQRRLVEIDENGLDARKASIVSPLPDTLPPGTITYSAQRPSQDSACAQYAQLYQETVAAQWNDRGRDVTTSLVRFRTFPPEEK